MDKPAAESPEVAAAKKRSAQARPDPREKRRLREAELLLEVTRQMASFDTLDEVLRALVTLTTAELGTERGSLFLNDSATNELYSRVAQGDIQREIRILNTSGIGSVVSGQPIFR